MFHVLPFPCVRRIKLVALTAAIVALAGCATADTSREQLVQRLAEERWNHLIGGQWQKAYDMLTSGYRTLHDVQDYQRQFKGGAQWRSAKVERVECEELSCEVRMHLTVSAPFARRNSETVSTYFNETWLNEGGRWYYYEKP